ncbi:uncharacterized protein LOC125673866 isoform X5 [Ostrea edulis]|uniref:uncharacterized protein LOC125673866 isoform X5 n=1 Tax=Ostrea edulis TaxID=37623 RepID=UPI0024AF742E|nr:uncharacterized protein LOC125673866 isoform X5 [Ostrea edulis]
MSHKGPNPRRHKGCYIKEPTTTRATPTIAMTTTIATTTQSVSTESRDSNYSTQGISREKLQKRTSKREILLQRKFY